MRVPYFMQDATVTGGGNRRLAVPWLAMAATAATGARPLRLPAAEWLLARAHREPAPAGDWRRWLIEGGGLDGSLLERLPAGPCVHAAAYGTLPAGTWACARPVHLLTGLDNLQLSPAEPVLDADEAATLLADINRHLDGTGFRVHDVPGGHWLLECAAAVDCRTVEPAQAAGCNLRDLMPGGRDGRRIRSLANELQMLLHEHPVNERRAERGLPAVNALWLWGFGAATSPGPAPLPPLCTDDPWLAGLWRAHGATPQSLDAFAECSSARGTVLLGWLRIPAADPVDCLHLAESKCFAPARAALSAGRADRIVLFAGESTFTTARRARLSFWRHSRPLAEVLA